MAEGGFGSLAEYLRHTVRQDLERADEAKLERFPDRRADTDNRPRAPRRQRAFRQHSTNECGLRIFDFQGLGGPLLESG